MFMTKPRFISSYNSRVILVWPHGPKFLAFHRQDNFFKDSFDRYRRTSQILQNVHDFS
jgi:hypothetical protein